MSLLQAAIIYATCGWAVLPCDPRGKVPLNANGSRGASADHAIVESWWRKWPTANVGIATGRASGLVVLDVDNANGKQGDRSLVALTKRGYLPETLTSRTGSGGAHLFFQVPDGERVANSQSKLGPGLDIRGDGGYVVAPPSIHANGKRYRWVRSDAAPALFPNWVMAELRPKARPLPAPLQQAHVGDVSTRLEQASRYVAKMPEAISGSGGHDALWAVALVLVRGFDLSTDAAFSLLAREYNPRCQPPWSEWELRHKLEDATRSTSTPGYLINRRTT